MAPFLLSNDLLPDDSSRAHILQLIRAWAKQSTFDLRIKIYSMEYRLYSERPPLGPELTGTHFPIRTVIVVVPHVPGAIDDEACSKHT